MTELYLINPPNPYNMEGFPGALLALDAWVRQRMPDVKSTIIDEEHSYVRDAKGMVDEKESSARLTQSLAEKLQDSTGTPIIGITCTTATYQDALDVAQAVKEIRSGATVVLGGHHCDGQERTILKRHTSIDAIVTGEGEKALEAILQGRTEAKGITTRHTLPQYGQENRGERLTPEELVLIDVRNFNTEYASTQFTEQNLVTARGCPMKCDFCAVAGEKANAQDSEQVVEQIDYLLRTRKEEEPLEIAIQDNFFAQSIGRARELAEKLITYRQNVRDDFTWNVQTRIEQFRTEAQNNTPLAQLFAEAGCDAVYFGVENFDPRMLKTLKKTPNPRYVRWTEEALTNCLEAGISPHIDLQVGLPGEDARTENINYDALIQIRDAAKEYDAQPMVFPSLSVVYPATGFHRKLMEDGVPEDIYETFTRWERTNPEYRESIEGYFAHGNGGVPHEVLDREALREGRIELDETRLSRVKAYVDRLREIDGIIVHDFTQKEREIRD